MNSRKSSPLVYIVVLTWNRKADTLECLLSLSEIWDERTRGIVVDNASSDGTVKEVRKAFPGLTVIENKSNLGFTEGNNVGILHALEQGADFILILNNDTIVDPAFLGEMLAVASISDRVGFVCPKILFFDPPDRIWFAGARFSTSTGYGTMIGYREQDRGQYEKLREIDRPCGCAVLVSRRLCEEAGLMNPDLFLYMDEVEWMLRARKKKFKAFYAPKARVRHKVSASVGMENHPDAFYYGVRNTLIALNLHERYPFPPFNWVRNVLVLLVYVGSLLVSPCKKKEGFRAVAAGVLHYLQGISGRRGSTQSPE